MAKNKRNTRRPPAHNQQLHDNYVLALPASPLPPPPPPLLPSPPILTPSPTAVAEDCSDEDNYDEDEVDYSTSGGSSKLFRSPVPPSTGNNLAVLPVFRGFHPCVVLGNQ
ncbi:hypothetical protein Peur_063825 [Populus x canadensis]